MSEKELKIKVDNVGVLESVTNSLNAKNEAENRAKELEIELNNQKSKNGELEEQLAKAQGGGSGSLPSSLNSGEGGAGGVDHEPKKEFEGRTIQEASEKMLDWAKINDPAAYAALKKQTLEAIAGNRGYVEIKDYFDEEGRSIIGRTLHKSNLIKRGKKE